MSVSKFPKLEIFSCYKCPIENSVAYFSIAVSNGFKRIKVFDVRLSGLGNTFLRSFMRKSNVMVIYFRNKDTSYELDHRNRAAQLSKQELPVPNVQFMTSSARGNEENSISDFGTLEFSRTIATNENCSLPKSVLYTYPYPPCTCGFKNKKGDKLKLGNSEVTNSFRTTRATERNLVEIITGDDWKNLIMEENSERANSKGNGDTEKRHSSEKNTSGCVSNRSAADGNSPLDARTESQSSAFNATLNKLVSIKKPLGPSMPNEAQSECSNSGQSSPDAARCHNHMENMDVQPSTSGLSAYSNKRKFNDATGEEETKRQKLKEPDAERSSSSSDDDDEDLMVRRAVVSSPSLRSGEVGDSGRVSSNIRSRGDTGTSSICTRNRDDSNSNDRPVDEASTPREARDDRLRIIVHPNGVNRNTRGPARTQVYPCACGNHSVIVVTTDENDDNVPPVPLENHCAHQHCEQRINLNAHQSLMVINNNEAPFGMPEIQLVDLNRERPLECCLKHLSFRGYDRVSDLTLTNIQNLHLELLDVTYTRCTRKGVLDFLKTNPNCRVLHKEFCVCLPKLDF